MSLSKSKCLYSNNCLHFLKRAVPLKSQLKFANFFQTFLLPCCGVQLFCDHDSGEVEEGNGDDGHADGHDE
jgi:hypothetical protein